jgi:dihydrofolate reductase
MRRLVVWNVMTLDGFFEGATPWDLGFHQSVWGDELEAFSREQLAGVGTLLFGRRTYTGMAGYWSTTADEGATAPMMNAVPKAVISNTLAEATWNNTRLLRGPAEDAVRALKAEKGEDIYVFGSAELLDALLRAGLVDEYRLCIAPVVLGQGNPLFKRSDAALSLRLKSARPLASGGLLAFYGLKAA